jgi:pantoate kinase
MRNTEIIIKEGMKCLLNNLGDIETEIFIANLRRERFDYTKWQKEYFKDIQLEDFLEKAARYDKEHPFIKK